MIEVKKEQMNQIAPLFEGTEDSMVISCLQGCMGNAYVGTLNHPRAALIVSGEYSFFAGDANSTDAINLVRNLFNVNKSESTIVIFDDDNPEWKKRLLSVPKNNPVIVPRFGIVQKDYDFDVNMLQECSERKIRPCWNAANLTSKKMALSLGYEYKGEYTTIHMKRSLPIE